MRCILWCMVVIMTSVISLLSAPLAAELRPPFEREVVDAIKPTWFWEPPPPTSFSSPYKRLLHIDIITKNSDTKFDGLRIWYRLHSFNGDDKGGLICRVDASGTLITQQKIEVTPLVVLPGSDDDLRLVADANGLVCLKDGREQWRLHELRSMKRLDKNLMATRENLLAESPDVLIHQETVFIREREVLRAISMTDGSEIWSTEVPQFESKDRKHLLGDVSPKLFVDPTDPKIIRYGYSMHRGRLDTWTKKSDWDSGVPVAGWNTDSGDFVKSWQLLNGSTIFWGDRLISIDRRRGMIRSRTLPDALGERGEPEWTAMIPQHPKDLRGSRNPITLTSSNGPLLVQDWCGGLVSYSHEDASWKRWFHGQPEPHLLARDDRFTWTHGGVVAIRRGPAGINSELRLVTESSQCCGLTLSGLYYFNSDIGGVAQQTSGGKNNSDGVGWYDLVEYLAPDE